MTALVLAAGALIGLLIGGLWLAHCGVLNEVAVRRVPKYTVDKVALIEQLRVQLEHTTDDPAGDRRRWRYHFEQVCEVLPDDRTVRGMYFDALLDQGEVSRFDQAGES
jgi:hypothetical protein